MESKSHAALVELWRGKLMSDHDELAVHHHAPHTAPGQIAPGALLQSLPPQVRAFAHALRPAHDELKLATLVAAGATLLFDQERIAPTEFKGRIAEAVQAHERAAATVAGLEPVAGTSWQTDYLDAISAALAALMLLSAAGEATERSERRNQIGPAIEQFQAAHLHMRSIGETFWLPEYIASSSEVLYHTHLPDSAADAEPAAHGHPTG